ncbi:MAG: phosphoglucosamine mutase [Bacteroidales bacterium]|nr:phosphoglucosamine mutase [Bacteroidales bacterium]
MTLIKSISGIRATIGGEQGVNLTPPDVLKFVTAYGKLLKERNQKTKLTVIVGRDARISGPMVNHLVTGTLMGLGINIVEIGLATTPTVEMAVIHEKADGGIIITASHNPGEWNALKLLNEKGEFLNAEEGQRIVELAAVPDHTYSKVSVLGIALHPGSYHKKHIDKILDLALVDLEAIRKADFKVAIDCVNSVGGLAIPQLLEALGVSKVIQLYCDPNGKFPHNPEPLPANLSDIFEKVKSSGADVGFVVDPDVDRLAIVNEDGTFFGEEYTLVAVADYVLQNSPGNTVSNLSSTRALNDVTVKHGGKYFSSAVGEVNVVEEMKLQKAVIGGEGNGGVIYPALHSGRDALVGIALFLSHLAKSGLKCSELRKKYPEYYITKTKVQLDADMNFEELITEIKKKFSSYNITTIDGIRVDLEKEWFHIRKSNTEPIVRIIAESNSVEGSEVLVGEVQEIFSKFQ